MKKKLNLKEKYRKFRAWQKQPRQVAPMSQDEHECLNCHDHYIGSFCPRCGQSATTGRFSMKVAMENFADAYGMGERGMFRTMRDLVLRPGYLILDYLHGMRVSYFAPFKMYFLLVALSLLVTHGMNIKGANLAGDDEAESVVQEVKEERAADDAATVEVDISKADEKSDAVGDRTKTILYNIMDNIERFEKRFPSIFILMLLMFISGYLYLFFRHSPNIPDLRYPEFFISLVYVANMYTVYSIVFDFFCLETISSYIFFLTLIPLKQMSGYSWWRTILKAVVAFVTMFVMFIMLIVFVVLAIGLCVKWFG